jgi:hypothetical protein
MMVGMDDNPLRQRAADSAIVKILERHGYKDLPNRFVPEFTPGGDTIDGVDIATIPTDVLEQSIKGYKSLIAVWNDRLVDLKTDYANTLIRAKVTNLSMFEHFAGYNAAMIEIQERNTRKIYEEIDHIRRHLSSR